LPISVHVIVHDFPQRVCHIVDGMLHFRGLRHLGISEKIEGRIVHDLYQQ
jgi:hypothetical protein